ncbi:MAG: hypothetical protein IIA59_06945 [Candidatus Marinimicrobia bacterium]|nr:hypothetical protein [Candidatus Neomarinimicrobiota bacterium]
MKTRRSLFLILAVMLAGCTRTYIVRPTAPAIYESINERGLRMKAIITPVKGRKQTGHKLRITPDSTSWVDPRTQSVVVVQTADVTSILFVDREKGALEGSILGFLTGALTGSIIGLTADPTCPSPLCITSPIAKALLIGLPLGALTGLFGLKGGGSAGSQEIFRIEHESPDD